MYKTNKAVAIYFDTLVQFNVKEKDVKAIKTHNNNLNIITNENKVIVKKL